MHTLNCKIMNTKHPQLFSPCPPNSRTPVPFETELFRGVCLLLLRTEPMDSHYRAFFHGTKRQFEVQVQGRFKRQPTGEIYVGAGIYILLARILLSTNSSQISAPHTITFTIRFVTIDITKKMEMGMLTRSMCRMALKFVGTMVNDLHYSFGDVPNSKDWEVWT